MADDQVQKSSGLRPPPDPPEDADGFDVVPHYTKYWEMEFARTRRVVKRRASIVVVTVSGATALIAVTGAATTILGWAWLGIVSAVLAGLATVISAWDSLFRHRELWHQRSVALGGLQSLRRSLQFRVAAGEDRLTVARGALAELDRVLSEDLNSWLEIGDGARAVRTSGEASPDVSESH